MDDGNLSRGDSTLDDDKRSYDDRLSYDDGRSEDDSVWDDDDHRLSHDDVGSWTAPLSSLSVLLLSRSS